MNIYVYEGSNGLALFHNKIIKRLKYARKQKKKKKNKEVFTLLAWNKVPRVLDFLNSVGKLLNDEQSLSIFVICYINHVISDQLNSNCFVENWFLRCMAKIKLRDKYN